MIHHAVASSLQSLLRPCQVSPKYTSLFSHNSRLPLIASVRRYFSLEPPSPLPPPLRTPITARSRLRFITWPSRPSHPPTATPRRPSSPPTGPPPTRPPSPPPPPSTPPRPRMRATHQATEVPGAHRRVPCPISRARPRPERAAAGTSRFPASPPPSPSFPASAPRAPAPCLATRRSRPPSLRAPRRHRTCRVRRKVSPHHRRHATPPAPAHPPALRARAPHTEMRRGARRRLVQDVPPPPHKVPWLGPQAARLDAGASAVYHCAAAARADVFLCSLLLPDLSSLRRASSLAVRDRPWSPVVAPAYCASRSDPRLWRAQDKEKVAAYKASIKEQLSRMGLIRGQPRQPWHGAGLPASQPPTPGVAGPGPQTSLRRTVSAREPYRRGSSGYAVAASPYHHQVALANSVSGKRRTSDLFKLCVAADALLHPGERRPERVRTRVRVFVPYFVRAPRVRVRPGRGGRRVTRGEGREYGSGREPEVASLAADVTLRLLG